MDSRDAVETVRAALPAVVVSLAAGAAAVAGSYAAAGFTPGYVVAPIESVLAQNFPGFALTFAVVVLGDLGQQLSLIGATTLSAVVLGVFAGLGWQLAERSSVPAVGIPIAGALTWAPVTLLTGAPVLALGAGLAAALVVGVVTVAGHAGIGDGEPAAGRRRLVGSLASVAGVGIVAWLLGRGKGGSGAAGGQPTPLPFQRTAGSSGDSPSSGDEGGEAAADNSTPSRTQALLAEAERKSFDVDGLEPLVSGDFYRVDINSVDPEVEAREWSLTVTGDVESETSFSYQDIVEMESTQEFATLRCVGEQLNGKKTDNALWEGVPAMKLLEEAGVPDNCCVMLRAADGYFEEFPLAALRDAKFAYRMNGELLPRAHGYPVRALVPGHWGEINVKWVEEIEILNEPAEGYWERRGWHGTGPVNTIAKLYTTNTLSDGRKQVAGHAYAGTRGIQSVEVSTDGGSTWSEAELTKPLPGEDVWRQWKYEYDPPGGSHEVVVRATDGEGNLQPDSESGPFPSGPTGWVSKTVQS